MVKPRNCYETHRRCVDNCIEERRAAERALIEVGWECLTDEERQVLTDD